MSTTFEKSRPAISPDRIIVGLAFTALGLLLLLQQMGYRAAGDIVGGWWPIVIVALGGAHFASSRGTRIAPLIVVIVGVVLLAHTLDYVPGSILGLVWPVVLVGVGLAVLLHSRDGRVGRSYQATSDENDLDLSASFGGITHVSHAPQFRHARLNASWGGIVLDLRRATLDPAGATVDASATCGGVEIRVPIGWRVQMSGSPVFGGYESEALQVDTLSPNAPRLQVNVTAVCGGVSVKH
jgi:predicted membrane protein